VVFLFFSFFFHCFEPVGPEVRDSKLGNGSKVILSGPVDLKHMRGLESGETPLTRYSTLSNRPLFCILTTVTITHGLVRARKFRNSKHTHMFSISLKLTDEPELGHCFPALYYELKGKEFRCL